MDVPDVGPTALAQYCDVTGRWFHLELLVGAEDCSVSRDDDSIILKEDIAYHSGKCIPAMGKSIIMECILGSCPGSNSNSNTQMVTMMNDDRPPGLVDDVERPRRRGLHSSWVEEVLMQRMARNNNL
jgi:hypothetical protein